MARRVLDGDVEAYALVVARHKDAVFAVARRHGPPGAAEELAHEAFVKGYERLGQYRRDDGLAAWLKAIAVRLCVDAWRQEQRRAETGLDHWDEARGERQPRDAYGLVETRQLVDKALDVLDARDRVLVGLYYEQEHTTREIAGMLDMSVALVKVRLFRARALLKKRLDVLMEP